MSALAANRTGRDGRNGVNDSTGSRISRLVVRSEYKQGMPKSSSNSVLGFCRTNGEVADANLPGPPRCGSFCGGSCQTARQGLGSPRQIRSEVPDVLVRC